MALSTELTQDVNKTLQQKLDGIEFYQEQIHHIESFQKIEGYLLEANPPIAARQRLHHCHPICLTDH